MTRAKWSTGSKRANKIILLGLAGPAAATLMAACGAEDSGTSEGELGEYEAREESAAKPTPIPNCAGNQANGTCKSGDKCYEFKDGDSNGMDNGDSCEIYECKGGPPPSWQLVGAPGLKELKGCDGKTCRCE